MLFLPRGKTYLLQKKLRPGHGALLIENLPGLCEALGLFSSATQIGYSGHSCNPNPGSWEVDVGGLETQGHPSM